jgi:hypothetical protein
MGEEDAYQARQNKSVTGKIEEEDGEKKPEKIAGRTEVRPLIARWTPGDPCFSSV